MADLTHPDTADDGLSAQMVAREIASQEDAARLGPLRSLAAARALGIEIPDSMLDEDTLVLPDEPVIVTPSAPPAPLPPMAPPDPVISARPVVEDSPAPPAPVISAPSVSEGPVAPPAAAPGPWPMPTPDEHPLPTPTGVVVPSGGPARVTTGVLAAAAAQRSRGERPVMELKPTVLATEIDRLGDQLVVLQDRLELRDRHNGLRRSLALVDIVDVEVQRRFTSAVLVVTTRVATDMVIKGLRPETAEAARQAILELRPPEVPLVSLIDERALMRAIVELHRAGVLDDDELALKTAHVARLAGRSL